MHDYNTLYLATRYNIHICFIQSPTNFKITRHILIQSA